MTALLLTVAMTVPAPFTLTDWHTAYERYPRWVPAPPAPAVESGPVERWRPLVAEHFDAAFVDDALSVIDCESGGNPDAANPRSSARGLFQHLASFWPERSAAAGWGGASIFDPEANIAVAAWLSKGGTDWSHWAWVCRP